MVISMGIIAILAKGLVQTLNLPGGQLLRTVILLEGGKRNEKLLVGRGRMLDKDASLHCCSG